MAGINIQDLPQALQQKLQPYVNIAKDIDSAIDMAKRAGKWTAADDKTFAAINGNKAWGQFDGFQRNSEVAETKKDLSEAMKEDPTNAFALANKKGVARDVANNPKKYEPKKYKMPSGRSVVYQKDKNTGKDTYTYYDVSGKKMTAQAFNKAEGVKSVRYVKGDEVALPGGNSTWGRDAGYIASRQGQLLVDRVKKKEESSDSGLMAVLSNVFTLGLASCSKGDDVHEYNFYNENKNTVNITFDTASLLAAMQEVKDLLAKINNNTSLTTQELNEIKNQLNKIYQQIATIIANQEDSAANADAFYKQILNVCQGNQELLKFIVDQLAQGNETLTLIKELMEKSNATQQEILEAVSKCKYGIDKLHEDNQDIKKLLTTIAAILEKLPDNLKDKFSAFFKSIITGIADNGAKLDALINLLKVVNANVQAGHNSILNKMDKMQAVLDALFAKFSEFDAKTTNLLNAIATAIANMATANVDLDKIERTLSAILDKIGKNGEEMEKLTKLLEEINKNTVINGETQKAILDAINKLDGNMIEQFEKLVKIGNKNTALQEQANALIQQILDAINNLDIQPGSTAQIDLSALIDAININGANLSSQIGDLYTMLTIINANVIEGNQENKIMLTKILCALTKLLEAPNLDDILAKLDEILNAIKNHEVEVKVTVEGHITIYDKDGNVIHEGELDNLDWVLG